MENLKVIEIIKIQSEVIHFLSDQLKSMKNLAPLDAERLKILLQDLDRALKEM